MVIRRAEKGDIEGISELLRQVNLIHYNGRPDIFKKANKYTASELSEIIADDERPVLVCVIGGKVSGYAFCVFQQHKNDNLLTDIKTLYIDDLCVDENARGSHIGSELYSAVLNLAKEAGCYNVTLNVWSFNENAAKFYEAMGMKPLKTAMEKILE